MTARAFNLLEVAVAAAIAGIVSASAVSSFAVLNRQLVRLQAESTASDDAKTLIDFLVSDLQAVGGGNVRPWMALWVEDNGTASTRDVRFGQAGRTSDRVTYGLTVPGSRTCTIASMTSTDIVSTGSDATCCFFQLQNTDKAGFFDSSATDPNFHTVIVKGGASRQISLSNLVPATCTMKWKPGPMAGIDNVDGDAFIDSADATVSPVTDFTNGSLSAVSIRTVYLNETTHQLLSFEERRGFNGVDVTIDPDERSVLGSNVFDLQLQLGFDGDPADGRLFDAGTTSDEWLYNADSDALPSSVSTDDLRMVAVGVIVGAVVKDPSYSTSAQVRGGAVKTASRTHMRAGMGKAALRNVFVFF